MPINLHLISNPLAFHLIEILISTCMEKGTRKVFVKIRQRVRSYINIGSHSPPSSTALMTKCWSGEVDGDMGHLRATVGHLKVTIGHHRITIGHFRVTLVTLGHLFFSFFKQTSDKHY